MNKKKEKYLVAYLDILGGKDLIRNDKNNESLNLVYDCYEIMMHYTQHILNGSYNIKIFSDNIVIAIPSNFTMTDDNNPVIAFNRISEIVCAFQRAFLQKNILIRGGVAFGELFIDDMIVWGPALINAYELENKVANYPRIVVDEMLLRLNNAIVFNPPVNLFEVNNISKDFDDVFFFNYLNYPDDPKVRLLIEMALTNVNKKIESGCQDRVMHKYYWHKNYMLSCKQKWNAI